MWQLFIKVRYSVIPQKILPSKKDKRDHLKPHHKYNTSNKELFPKNSVTITSILLSITSWGQLLQRTIWNSKALFCPEFTLFNESLWNWCRFTMTISHKLLKSTTGMVKPFNLLLQLFVSLPFSISFFRTVLAWSSMQYWRYICQLFANRCWNR